MDEENYYRRRKIDEDLKDKLKNEEDIIDFETNTKSFKDPVETTLKKQKKHLKKLKKYNKHIKSSDYDEDS